MLSLSRARARFLSARQTKFIHSRTLTHIKQTTKCVRVHTHRDEYTRTLSRTHSLCLYLSLTHTHTHTHSLSLTHTYIYKHTQTHTHTQVWMLQQARPKKTKKQCFPKCLLRLLVQEQGDSLVYTSIFWVSLLTVFANCRLLSVSTRRRGQSRLYVYIFGLIIACLFANCQTVSVSTRRGDSLVYMSIYLVSLLPVSLLIVRR